MLRHENIRNSKKRLPRFRPKSLHEKNDAIEFFHFETIVNDFDAVLRFRKISNLCLNHSGSSESRTQSFSRGSDISIWKVRPETKFYDFQLNEKFDEDFDLKKKNFKLWKFCDWKQRSADRGGRHSLRVWKKQQHLFYRLSLCIWKFSWWRFSSTFKMKLSRVAVDWILRVVGNRLNVCKGSFIARSVRDGEFDSASEIFEMDGYTGNIILST